MNLDLNHLLQYKNNRILDRYKKDFPRASLSAEEALQEFLKFVWLNHQHRYEKKQTPHNQALNFACVIHEEMTEIDNMWHTFLLFTRDYEAFCQEYLNGHFFHHDPTDENNKKPTPEEYETELTRYLSYIYDKLGEETVIKWFSPPMAYDPAIAG